MNYVLRVLVLNRPAVLARVAGQVARRGVNIDHFTARNVAGGRTVIAIGIDSDEQMADRLAKGVARLIDVLEVTWRQDDEPPPPPPEPGAWQPQSDEKEGRCRGTR